MKHSIRAAFWSSMFACMPLDDLSSYSEGALPVMEESDQASGRTVAAGEDGSEEMLATVGASPPGASSEAAGSGREPAIAVADLSGAGNVAADAGTASSEGNPALMPEPDAGMEVGPDSDGSAPGPVRRCDGPGEFSSRAGRCFSLAAGASSWDAARRACGAWGGTLARIDSRAEAALIATHLATDTWIGLNDLESEGIMRWDGGGELGAYGPWSPNQPDDFLGEDCVVVSTDGRWNDRPCGDVLPYLCVR
jgi:hypothetical protein